MKSILCCLFFIIGNNLFAQERETMLEINTSIASVSCENDNVERNFLIAKIEDSQKTLIGTYQGIGCKFELTKTLSPGKYSITISGLSFQEEVIVLELTEDNKARIILNSVLKEKINSLDEVTVYGNKRQYLKVESDKTTVSIKENVMLNSGSTLDAIKKLPGVITSPAGGVTLNGKNVAVYIDGAPSTLTGTDLQNYLSGLPAGAIEKVELIYNPGASYDANSSGSVINIVTNTKKMKGINASFNINYNFNKYQKPSPQVLMNGKHKRLSWQTMIGYNYIDSEIRNNNLQEFTSFTPSQYLLQENLDVRTQRNFYFRTGTNYKLSSKSNLLFNYNLNLGNDRIVTEASTLGTDIDFTNNGTTKDPNSAHEFSLQYKTKLDTLGRTLDITGYTNLFGRKPNTESTSLEDNVNTYNNSKLDFGLENYYLKYDFAFPFEKFSINTGGKYNILKVQDFGQYNLESPDSGIFDSDIYASSIDFNYSEYNLAFYAEARKKIKQFNFTAGLRFEDYQVKRDASTIADEINFSNTKFFPNLSVMYEFPSNINLNASYSKKISQPGYYVLDPNNSSLFNRYNTSMGNVELKPVFFDNFELKMTAMDYVQVGANYTIQKDLSQLVFTAEDGELVSNRTFISFDEMRTVTAFASFPIPLDYFFKGKEEFKKRMSAVETMNYIYLNLAYIQSDVTGNDIELPNKGAFNFTAQSQFILPWGITNVMSYNILGKGYWQIYQIQKPLQQFDISFNKTFLNKRLNIGLHCFDVFNSYEVNAGIPSTNLNTNFYEKMDTRTFRFSLTYNFGNLSLEKEETQINVEKVNQGGGTLK
jgi:iron complex outermembrane receptor protein